MFHTRFRSCYNSLHLVPGVSCNIHCHLEQSRTIFLGEDILCFEKEVWNGFHKLSCSKVQPGERGKCSCELYNQAVNEGIKVLFVKLSNRRLWMGEWQLLAILLHRTAVISAAAAILSRLHMEISVCVCMCGHWFDTVCGNRSYLAVQSIHHYPWVNFAHKPCSRWWEIQTWTTQVIIY